MFTKKANANILSTSLVGNGQVAGEIGENQSLPNVQASNTAGGSSARCGFETTKRPLETAVPDANARAVGGGSSKKFKVETPSVSEEVFGDDVDDEFLDFLSQDTTNPDDLDKLDSTGVDGSEADDTINESSSNGSNVAENPKGKPGHIQTSVNGGKSKSITVPNVESAMRNILPIFGSGNTIHVQIYQGKP